MVTCRVLKHLWDYGLVWQAESPSRMARGMDMFLGLKKVLKHTINISAWSDFKFYNPVWYWDMTYMDLKDGPRKIG